MKSTGINALPSAAFSAQLAAARASSRRILGVDETVMVYELESGALDAGPRSLVFETPSLYWRLRRYPSDWRTMTDEQLLALDRTSTVRESA